MGRNLLAVLGLIVLLGQTYSENVDVEDFLNQIIESKDVDIEKLIQEEILSKHGDLESLFEEAIESDDTDLETEDGVDLDPEEILGGCRRGVCKYCIRKFGYSACVIAKFLRKNLGFSLEVTLNGRRIYFREISVRNPPPYCVNKIPWISKIGNVCVRVYNVNLRRKSACVRLEFKVQLSKWFKKTIKIRIACFKIPILPEDEMEVLDQEPIVGNPTLTYQ